MKRVSDRIMYMKLDIEGVMMTVISAYAPQVGCLMEDKNKIGDCKVIAGENLAKQHRLLVRRMTLESNKRNIAKVESMIKWWKLKKEGCCEEFRRR